MNSNQCHVQQLEEVKNNIKHTAIQKYDKDAYLWA